MKFRYLDGLRGIAALVVVFDHLAFMFVPFAVNGGGVPHGVGPLLHNTPLQVLISGDLAVCIFFILSGIVLSARFFRTGDRQVVVNSAVKRYFRLAIPVFGSVMIAYLLIKLGLMHNQAAGALTSDWWKGFWGFGATLKDALYQGTYGVFLTNEYSYNPVLWTMKLEFIGSFLVFAVLGLFGRLRNRWVAYTVLCLLLMQTYMLAFLLGVMICDYVSNSKKLGIERILSKGFWVPVLLVALVLGSYPISNNDGTIFRGLPERQQFVALVHIIASFGIIVAIMSSGLLKKVLEMRGPQFLGRISFSLYLLHFLILGSYASYLYVTLAAQMSLKSAMLLTIPPTFAVLMSAAYLYAKYVDEPAIRLSGRILQRWFADKPTVVAEKATAAEPVQPAKPAGAAVLEGNMVKPVSGAPMLQ